MRALLFFDLPVLTEDQRRSYRKFVKNIKKLGFYMLQESVYVKLSIDSQNLESSIKVVERIAPSKGSVLILTVTETQFSKIRVITGDFSTNIINNDERTIIL